MLWLLADLTLALGGDVLILTSPPESALVNLRPYLLSADLSVVNLEGPLTTWDKPRKKTVKGRSYAFKMNPRVAFALSWAGVDAVNIANNHINDYGSRGVRETLAWLDSAGVSAVGLRGTVAKFEVDGQRVALLGFGHSPGCEDIRQIARAESLVASLADSFLVIVTFHGGAEGARALHVPKRVEKFYGENRGDVWRFARAVVDAGADLVFGHGPHVPRGLEVYKGRLIAYSLGNLCTPLGMNLAPPNGYAPLLLVWLADDGSFVSGEIVSFKQIRGVGPVPDSSGGAWRLIERLSEEDFPETSPLFEDGVIWPR